jgi:hypothetical protein
MQSDGGRICERGAEIVIDPQRKLAQAAKRRASQRERESARRVDKMLARIDAAKRPQKFSTRSV